MTFWPIIWRYTALNLGAFAFGTLLREVVECVRRACQ